MRPLRTLITLAVIAVSSLVFSATAFAQVSAQRGSAADIDARMAWWRDARFGMFIHWGLYAIPGGEWGGPHGGTNHAEWIRTTAQIPLEEYDTLLAKFNPVNFNADEIVLAAKNAGMSYIVITSKHHDGFCLFDTATTDFDVMSTPFKRDILREMADACRRHGLKICWYYSIMDWHHPDYLPRRDWEKDRPTEGADFDRYVAYMKAQLKELLTNYGEIGVLWFDGQWEGNWTDVRGRDLEKYVRSISPNIIINSRVGRAGGNYGLDSASGMLGDYATPEQFIPDSDPGFDWETCMTMNDHWGYNRADKNFKSTTDLIRKLVDISSKGGNFLLNIGPDELGRIPAESVSRLREIGEWWGANELAVRGTSASPFPAGQPAWGRCTTRRDSSSPGQTLVYLHVFDWPADGRLVVPGLFNEPVGRAVGFARTTAALPQFEVTRAGDDLVVNVGSSPLNRHSSTVALTVRGEPDVSIPPTMSAAADIFIGSLSVDLSTRRKNVQVRYTVDGTDPGPDSPVASGPLELSGSAEVRGACFRDGKRVSPVAARQFRRIAPRPAAAEDGEYRPGLHAQIHTFDGDIRTVDAMEKLTVLRTATVPDFALKHVQPREKHWGVFYSGFVRVPKTAVYEFITASDDGSRLWIGDSLIVDNDLPHSFKAERGFIALEAGLHPIRVGFFENWGGFDLRVTWRELGNPERAIDAADLFHQQ